MLIVFATRAEKAQSSFLKGRYKSLVTACKAFGAVPEKIRVNGRLVSIYRFSDNSVLKARGRGRNHVHWASLS